MARNKRQPNLPPVPRTDAGTTAPQAQSKSERREQAARLAAERRRAARRRRILVQVGVGAAIVLLAVGIGAVVVTTQGPDEPDAVPAGLTVDGGIRFGSDDAAVVVQTVEDFQCPICQQFESSAGDLLAGYRDGTDVAVEYRPIAFLDRMSSTDYSTRALNASMCVRDAQGDDAWLAYHQALYAAQPDEGGEGLPDSELLQMASDVGATGDTVTACVEDQRYAGWAAATTKAAFDDQVTGTPTVFVDGQVVDSSPAVIQAAVQAAGGS